MTEACLNLRDTIIVRFYETECYYVTEACLNLRDNRTILWNRVSLRD